MATAELNTSVVPTAGIRTMAPLLSLMVSVCLLFANAVSEEAFVTSSLQTVSLFAVVTGVVCLCLVTTQLQRHIWSFAAMLLLLMALFHLGLFVGPALGQPLYLLTGSGTDWVYTPEARRAIWYSTTCLACYAVGANAFRLIRGPDEAPSRQEADGFGVISAQVGSMLLIASVVSWFAIVFLLLGLDVFRQSYLDFFQATQSSAITYSNLGIAIGLTMVCVNTRSRWAKVGLMAFAVFALASLVIGARSTIMFPAAAGAVVLAYGRSMPRLRWLGLIIFSTVTIMGAVRLLRLRTSPVTPLELAQSPITGLAELGYTIRVVQASFWWHGVRNEPYMTGATYVGWLSRLYDRGILHRPLPASDFRLMNVEVGQRIGGQGGSILAEAHHNFGALGGFALIVLLGFAAAWISRAPRSGYGAALVGVVAAPVFLHVRNSFTPVIFALVCGLVLVRLSRLVQLRNSS